MPRNRSCASFHHHWIPRNHRDVPGNKILHSMYRLGFVAIGAAAIARLRPKRHKRRARQEYVAVRLFVKRGSVRLRLQVTVSRGAIHAPRAAL